MCTLVIIGKQLRTAADSLKTKIKYEIQWHHLKQIRDIKKVQQSKKTVFSYLFINAVQLQCRMMP